MVRHVVVVMKTNGRCVVVCSGGASLAWSREVVMGVNVGIVWINEGGLSRDIIIDQRTVESTLRNASAESVKGPSVQIRSDIGREHGWCHRTDLVERRVIVHCKLRLTDPEVNKQLCLMFVALTTMVDSEDMVGEVVFAGKGSFLSLTAVPPAEKGVLKGVLVQVAGKIAFASKWVTAPKAVS